MLEAFKEQNRWEFREVKGFDLVGLSMAISNQDLGELGHRYFGNMVG